MASKAQDDEYNRIYKILNFRLPHGTKRLGLMGAILIFLVLLGSKFMGTPTLLQKDVLRSLILFFLLLASLSKDELEDEYNRQIRYHSFVIAFVVAVAYSIVIPLIAIVLDLAITKITGDGSVSFYEISAFEVLFSMLGIQLLSFETLKRLGRA